MGSRHLHLLLAALTVLGASHARAQQDIQTLHIAPWWGFRSPDAAFTLRAENGLYHYPEYKITMTFNGEGPTDDAYYNEWVDQLASGVELAARERIYGRFHSAERAADDFLSEAERQAPPLDRYSTGFQADYEYFGPEEQARLPREPRAQAAYLAQRKRPLLGTFRIAYENEDGEIPLDRTLRARRDLGKTGWSRAPVGVREEAYPLVNLKTGRIERRVRKVGGAAQFMELNNHMTRVIDLAGRKSAGPDAVPALFYAVEVDLARRAESPGFVAPAEFIFYAPKRLEEKYRGWGFELVSEVEPGVLVMKMSRERLLDISSRFSDRKESFVLQDAGVFYYDPARGIARILRDRRPFRPGLKVALRQVADFAKERFKAWRERRSDKARRKASPSPR